jgi:hypothetical protein
MPLRQPKTFTSREQFCRHYFPRAHGAKECRCYPKQGVLIILPRPGVTSGRW